MRIIFATGNRDKMKEIRAILADLGMEILSMKEAGLASDIVEDGATFEENAEIKARAVALGGEPGIYSARYMGEDTSYRVKNMNLIDRLAGVPDERRTARFVCAIAAVFPNGSCEVVRGTIEGRIGYEERGSNGFGYDPIFIAPEYGCTTAELSEEQKNRISHRGKALEKMKTIIKDRIEK